MHHMGFYVISCIWHRNIVWVNFLILISFWRSSSHDESLLEAVGTCLCCWCSFQSSSPLTSSDELLLISLYKPKISKCVNFNVNSFVTLFLQWLHGVILFPWPGYNRSSNLYLCFHLCIIIPSTGKQDKSNTNDENYLITNGIISC